MSETHTKQSANIQQLATALAAGSTFDSLIAGGASSDDVIAAIRALGEQRNREAQAKLAAPPVQGDAAWQARKAWLLDGQSIHGELKGFFWPALQALQADDQANYSRQRDLLFKALRTFLGDPPPEQGPTA